ncbi:MAG TPA: PASTA domain-containing protein, partial [Pilimelia sp.]|nr:PASTA domain-containing protein [Pilimelia sp.]
IDAAAGSWSARAEVPQYVPETTPEPAWRGAPPEPTRWWLPVLLGVVALLLLGALGYGALLLVGGDGGPQPVTPTAESVRRPTRAPTPRPTTARPRTTAPRPSPTTVAPQRVQVPDVVGENWRDARERLSERGLSYRLELVATDEAAPEQVVRTQPGVGATVAEGSVVTLVVAEAPAPAEPTDPPPTPEVT